MIIIRDLYDIDTLHRKILQGDILEIYNTSYGVSKFYFQYGGILTYCEAEPDMSTESWGQYCGIGMFHRDIRMALLEPNRYFIKLVEDMQVEVVRADSEICI